MSIKPFFCATKAKATAQSKKDKQQPLVFINKPIEDSKHDIVGFSTQIDTICEAIKDGSTMIGVVANYGTGKSSLTELLSSSVAKKPFCFPAPIKINMWDCLVDSEGFGKCNHTAEPEVSDLTRSFLYQLANGNDKKRHFSSYINKRLSRNYGNISLTTGSFKFWWCFILAALFYTAYMIFSNDTINFGKVIRNSQFLEGLKLGQAFSPAFLLVAVLFLVWGIVHTCIVFSHWKMQNSWKTDVNDIFDVYAQVVDHIKPGKGKKQLIIVEDLDRIVEKAVIIGFLKELYRFQSSTQRYSNRFVFVVSIKPEAVLTKGTQELLIDDDNVYSKLFDIIIPLKPIHYDDYDAILLELIKREPAKKIRLEQIIGEDIEENILPKSFFWIKNGENLTLRDLKDRLNHAIMIMISRSTYNVRSAVTFEACAAVAYLESRYPKDYYALIQKENAFAKLMSSSVRIINSNSPATAIDGLRDEFNSQFPSESFDSNFIEDICKLIHDGVFNYDFRMYFYTYPSGSHIKTTEERELCDMLLMPSRFNDYSNIDSASALAYLTGDDNIVTTTIKGLKEYPEAVLMNETLLRIACENDWHKAASAVKKYIIEPDIREDITVNFWTRVHNIHFENKDSFQEELIESLLKSFSSAESVIHMRQPIIKAYGKDVLDFKKLFFKSSKVVIPQISADEIAFIGDASIAVNLIDAENLTVDSFGYISSLLCYGPLDRATLDIARNILLQYRDIDPDGYEAAVLQFLDINGCIDEVLLEAICKSCDKDALLKYLNSLDPSLLPDAYYNDIEECGFAGGLSADILQGLASRKQYRCILLAASATNDFVFLDTLLDNSEPILSDCEWLHKNNSHDILSLRWHLCIEKRDSRYWDLYRDPFPLICENEYTSFQNTSDAIECINTDNISVENCSDVLAFLHQRSYSCNEGMLLIKQLFDPNQYSSYLVSQNDLFATMVNGLDYTGLRIRELSYEDRETVYALVSEGFGLLNLEYAEQLRLFNCLIPSVEKEIEIQDSDLYEQLISELNELTPFTLGWMAENYFNYALSPELSNKLKENNDFENYITTSVLREKNMIIDSTIPKIKYLNVYINVLNMYDIMSNHWDFLESLQAKDSLEALLKSKRSGELISPIYKVPQHNAFFSFILSGAFPETTKMEYLDLMGKFASDEDSKSFQRLICLPENIELINSHKRYWKVWNNFWQPNHKALFTQAWNKRWKTELGHPC